MAREVKQVTFTKAAIPKLTRVAAYARVSSAKDAIPETTLTALTADLDIGDLTEIIAEDRNTLIFRFKDGKKAVKRWQDRSRAESWTPEMKEAARQKAIERNRHNG